MIVGYLFIGTVAGVVAFASALIAGRSIGIAFVMYAAVGAAVTMLIPLAQIALALLVAALRRSPQANEDVEIDFAPATFPEATIVANPPAAKRAMRILAVDDDPFILSRRCCKSRGLGVMPPFPVEFR